MIKHVNYQIRNIPFLVSETENVVPDAPLTNYPGKGFSIPAAKLLLFQDMTKFLTQPQNAYKSAICNRKRRFSNCIPNRKRENQIGVQKIQIEKGCPIGIFVYFQIDHPENENEKINPLDGADLECEKIKRKKAIKFMLLPHSTGLPTAHKCHHRCVVCFFAH